MGVRVIVGGRRRFDAVAILVTLLKLLVCFGGIVIIFDPMQLRLIEQESVRVLMFPLWIAAMVGTSLLGLRLRRAGVEPEERRQDNDESEI